MIMATQMQFHFVECPLQKRQNSKRNGAALAAALFWICWNLHAICRFHVPFFFWSSVSSFTRSCLSFYFDFAHLGLFLFPLCQLFSGGCINASPAGKRRIANGITQQQFGDDGLFGISGKLSTANDANGNNVFTPATTAITAIAIAACVLIISVFGIVFVVLQVRIHL